MVSYRALALIALLALIAAGCTLGATSAQTPRPLLTSTPALTLTARPASTTIPTLPPRPTLTSAPQVVLPPTVVNCTARADWATYTVAAGDTLFRIAQRGGTTVSELTRANCLANPNAIEVGQVLRVPNAVVTTEPTSFPGDPVRFYLIIPGDAGLSGPKVGCDDSVVGISTDGARSGVIASDIRASLEALFNVDTETYGGSGFINALYNSPLTVQNVSLTGDTVTVNLGGSLQMVGVCSDARMQAQLLYTIFQYPGFANAFVFVGGANMRQLFDASGTLGPGAMYTRAEVEF